MNTITNEMITNFNFFDFFRLSVDFEFKEFENEIYTFIAQHNIKFPKKAFLNTDDLLEFYDSFTFETHPSDISVLAISANVLSITLPLPYPLLKSISVDSNNCVFTSIDGILYSKNLDTILCFPKNLKFASYGIPTSVTSIGDSAFKECQHLQSITIPTSVTSIGNSAFSCCLNLQSIDVESNNLNYVSINGILFTKNLEKLVCFPAKHDLSSYTIPTSVTSIGDSAFNRCHNLESITIPTSVTSIGDSAFSWCYNLQSITIPTSVTSIGDSAFSDCSNLCSVSIPHIFNVRIFPQNQLSEIGLVLIFIDGCGTT